MAGSGGGTHAIGASPGEATQAGSGWLPHQQSPGLAAVLGRLEKEVGELLEKQHRELRGHLRAFVTDRSNSTDAASGETGAPARAAGGPTVPMPRGESFHSAGLRLLADTPELLDFEDEQVNCDMVMAFTEPRCTVATVANEDEVRMRAPPKPRAITELDRLSKQQEQQRAITIDSAEAASHANIIRGQTMKAKRVWATQALSSKARTGTDWQSMLLRLTGHWAYEVANAVLILSNALLTAWESQFCAVQVQNGLPRESVFFEGMMYIFCFMFTLDLALRMMAQRMKFFNSLDWKWNLFDAMVVFGALVESIASMTGSKSSFLSNPSLLRVVRLVRVTRIVQAFRSVVYFREFRITISMLCESILPLMTFSVIMTTVFMVFGIFFTDAATLYMDSQGPDDALAEYYGSLFSSMSTLFKAISGGMDWENAIQPLHELSWVYTGVFYAYVTFAIFGILNVVSAIFIDNTLQKSKGDRDFIVQQQTQGKQHFMATMEQLFAELDPDRSGTIRIHELQEKVSDPKVYAYFRAIDLSTTKVKRLFQLMDSDGSGDIDRTEFLMGCSRLCGEAKELDVAILQFEIRLMAIQVGGIKDLMVHLCQGLDQMTPVERFSMKSMKA